MMPYSILDMLALRVLDVWLLSLCVHPSGDWDETDPNCRREYGPHVIWTQCACVPADTDIEALKIHFQEYLARHNSCITAEKFGFYDLRAYDCAHCGGKHLYVSIYQ